MTVTDLSSTLYGGNKVRTLQHTLGIIQAGRSRKLFQDGIATLGSSGTNQVVATCVHVEQNIPGCAVEAIFTGKDQPELPNTLNLLSLLSYPLKGGWTAHAGFECVLLVAWHWSDNRLTPLVP